MSLSNETKISLQSKLAGLGLSGLHERLEKHLNVTINGYQIDFVYEVGGQSILYLAQNEDGHRAIIKIGYLPYHKAAYIEHEDILKARQRIIYEMKILDRFEGSLLPQFIDLIVAPNPLQNKARGHAITEKEPYLFMEYIEGVPLSELIRKIHSNSISTHLIEFIAHQIAIALLDQFDKFLSHDPPHIYTDLCPENIYYSFENKKPIRLLDAASIIPKDYPQNYSLPLRLTYAPPLAIKPKREKGERWVDIDYVCYSLGVTIWELLTNRQPFPDELLDLNDKSFLSYTKKIKFFLAECLQIKGRSDFSDLIDLIKSWEKNSEQSWTELYDALTLQSTISDNAIKNTYVQASADIGFERKTYIPDAKSISFSNYFDELIVTTPYGVSFHDKETLHIINAKCIELAYKPEILLLGHTTPLIYLYDGKGLFELWDIAKKKKIDEHPIRTISRNSFLETRSKEQLLALAFKEFVLVIDPISKKHQNFDPAPIRCQSLDFSLETSCIAIGGYGGVIFFDYENNKFLRLIKIKNGHDIFIYNVKFLQDNKILVLGGNLHSRICFSQVWDWSNSCLIWENSLPIDSINEFSQAIYSIHSKFFAIVDHKNNIHIWDIRSGENTITWTCTGEILSIDFSTDGKSLYILYETGEIMIYNPLNLNKKDRQ